MWAYIKRTLPFYSLLLHTTAIEAFKRNKWPTRLTYSQRELMPTNSIMALLKSQRKSYLTWTIHFTHLKNQDENPKWFRLPVLIFKIIADTTHAHIQCPNAEQSQSHHLSSDHSPAHTLEVKCFPTLSHVNLMKPEGSWRLLGHYSRKVLRKVAANPH